jgi:hypothetical protein
MGIKYVVEPAPLGTAGAIRYAGDSLRESVVVFNGDVLTQVDLAAVIRLHRERKARATIVLTPVDNPSAYGLVETDADGNVGRFLEKPQADEITCNTINAGISVLEPETFDRIPATPRVDRAQLLPVADRTRRDLRRLRLSGLLDRHRHAREIHPGAPRHHGRAVQDPDLRRQRPAHLDLAGGADRGRRERRGPGVRRCRRGHQGRCAYRSLHRPRPALPHRGACHGGTLDSVGEHPGRPGRVVRGSILGRQTHIGRSAVLDDGVVLGDKSVVTDFSRL